MASFLSNHSRVVIPFSSSAGSPGVKFVLIGSWLVKDSTRVSISLSGSGSYMRCSTSSRSRVFPSSANDLYLESGLCFL